MPKTDTAHTAACLEACRAKAVKLVALATVNPNKNEARNAAVKACQIAAVHKLLDAPPPTAVRMPSAEEVGKVVDRAGRAATAVREVAADPNVREVANAAATFVGGLSKVAEAFRKARRN